MAKQIRANEAIRVILTQEEDGRASGGGFIARPGTCPHRVLPAELDFQTGLERTAADEVNAGMIQHQIWDVAGCGRSSLLPPGGFGNGKHGRRSRLG